MAVDGLLGLFHTGVFSDCLGMRSWDDWLLTLQGKQRPIERHQKGEGIFEPKDTEEGVLLMI